MIIPYEELDKHFTAPKNLNEKPFFNYKRIPKGVKQQLKKRTKCKDYNTMLWYYMDENYKRFIIKKLCEIYNK